MKHLAAFFLLFVLSHAAFGQAKAVPPDEVLFEKGVLLQQLADEDLHLSQAAAATDSLPGRAAYAAQLKTTILEKALACYQQLLTDFPHSTLFYRALSNKAYAELALQDTAAAKQDFLAIIRSTAADKQRGGRGTGIMAEPYANFKNEAAKMLAEIALKEQEYAQALAYLDLTKKFPYQHFCGNAYAADEIYLGELYAKCYLGLHDYPSAYAAAFPNLLENGLANNKDLVLLTYEALLKNYSRQELKTQFEQAIQHYKVVTTQSGKAEYPRYVIVFLGVEVPLNSWNLQMADLLKAEELSQLIAKECMQSTFYALLTK